MSLSSCETPTVPLTAPITSLGNGNGAGMWGQEWIWIIVLFLFAGGWGNNGWGNGAGNGMNSPAAQGYDTRADIQRGFDNQSVVNKLNGLENGICSLGYDQLNQMNGITQTVMNGFHGVDDAVCQLGYNVQQGFNQATIANLQGQNALASQLAECCCTTQRAIDGINYNAALNANAIQNQLQQCCCDSQRDTMQTRFDMAQANCATLQAIDKLGDRIEARLTAQELAAKDAQIAAQNQRLFAAELAASQAQQTNALIDRLSPCPIPAYPACHPATPYSWPANGCGCNSVCGG